MYEIPSSAEIRDFLKRNHVTGSAAAEIVGAESRTVRKWTASEGAENRRAIPWSAWTLLRLYVGELELDAFRRQVIDAHFAKLPDEEKAARREHPVTDDELDDLAMEQALDEE